jgi:hypothetical protein
MTLLPCPFCGSQPKQSSCVAPELVRCVNDKPPWCPASFGGVSVETWNQRSEAKCDTCGGSTGFVMNRGTLDVCDDPFHEVKP